MDPPHSSKSDRNRVARNEEYIQTLEEKNRMKRLMTTKSEQEKQLENREKGFSTHFAGANSNTTKTPTVKPVVRGNSFKNLKPKTEGVRRGWAAADTPQFILGQKGPIPVRAPRGMIISNGNGDGRQHLSSDIDEIEDETQQRFDHDKDSDNEQEECEEDLDNDGEGAGEDSMMFEDSLEEAYHENDEEDPYQYEEDFEVDDEKDHDQNDEEEEEEEVGFRVKSDPSELKWGQGSLGSSRSQNTTPWKSVTKPSNQPSPITNPVSDSVSKKDSHRELPKSQLNFDSTPQQASTRSVISPITKQIVTPAPPSTNLSRQRESKEFGSNLSNQSQPATSPGPKENGMNSASIESQGKPNETSSSGNGLADAIAMRLASMSEAQQQQLMMMLNLVESGAAPQKPTTHTISSQQQSAVESSRSETQPVPSTPGKSPKRRKKRSPRRKQRGKDTTASETQFSDEESEQLKSETKFAEEESVVESSIGKNVPIPSETSEVKIPICDDKLPMKLSQEDLKSNSASFVDTSRRTSLTTIKIKLHNSWKRTKYSSLAAIRLLLIDDNKEIDLSEFSAQVWTGNSMLPKSSEVVHSVSNLFTKSRVRQHKDWKFPIDSGTQIILTGQLSVSLSELELLIWNGIVSDPNVSPVQDIDIYINNSLIWSGVLVEKISVDGIIRQMRASDISSRILSIGPNDCRPPSNIIPLSSTLNESKKATVRTTVPINPIKHIAQPPTSFSSSASVPKYEESLTFTGLSSTTDSSVGMSTTDFLNLESQGKKNLKTAAEDSSKINEPTWFSDLKTPRSTLKSQQGDRKIEFDDIPSIVQPPITKSGSINFDEELYPTQQRISRPGSRRHIATAEKEDNSKHVDQMTTQSQLPASRGSRRQKVSAENNDIRGAEKIDNRSKNHEGTKKNKRDPQNEISLRQSLEALNDSDRKNRGRLQQELTTVMIANGGLSFPGSTSNDFVNDSASAGQTQMGIPLEATVAVNLSNMQMNALENLSGGVLDQEMQSTTLQKRALKQRSERIDKVQEKVSSALASLAGVISSLPGGSKYGNQDTKFHGVSGNNQSAPIKSRRQTDSNKQIPAARNILSQSQEIQTKENSQEQKSQQDDDINNILEMVNGLDMEMSVSVFSNKDNLTQKSNASQSDNFLEASLCETPIFPKGRLLELDILSTWGDPYYVGLNGIDIFDQNGKILLLNHGISSITANPSDINVLPEYHDDPRTVLNLLDEVNSTRDDLHVWLAPHGSTMMPKLPNVATITITFQHFTTISMIRVWNYNKSRTHCYRGVKQCRMKFDNKVIFDGTIKMAPGVETTCDDCSEMIIFSTDQNVFKKILEYDISNGYQVQGLTDQDSNFQLLANIKEKKIDNRPRTADKNSADSSIGEEKVLLRRKPTSSKSLLPYEKVVQVSDGIRPTTAAIRPVDDIHKSESKSYFPSGQGQKKGVDSISEKLVAAPSVHDEINLVDCQTIQIVIEKTWGDKCYVGLAGVEILIGRSCIIADLDPEMIDASPRDLSAIGCFDDPRTPDKLIDGINDTTDDTHMWLIPFTKGSKHVLKFHMGGRCQLAGFNFWNYNKSPEDSLRGTRIISIYGDSTLIGTYELRLAPGCDGIEYKQTVLVRDIQKSILNRIQTDTLRYITPTVRQDYEVPLLPSGMNWKFTLHSNWGDGYYIGLDGLQFLDEKGIPISLSSSSSVKIEASPRSLEDIGVSDSRIPNNLNLEPFSDPNGSRSWLAPLSQCMTETERITSLQRIQLKQKGKIQKKVTENEPLFYEENVLFVLFDFPVTVSVIRLYNYTKSPKRGVKEFDLEIDGNIVYMGTLRSAENSEFDSTGQSILFTSDVKITRMEKSRVVYCGGGEQDVLCINERQVIVRSKGMYEPPNVASEGIYSDLNNRPSTALGS